MRNAFLMLALAMSLVLVIPGQQPEPPKKARIEGTVVGLTGEPVPRAQLRLTGGTQTLVVVAAGRSGGGDVAPPGSNVAATTDDAGKFVIENIEPGRGYQLNAQRPGFVTTRYGARSATAPGSPLTLDAGAELKDLVIKMTPQGVISGKVTDPAGDPLQNALVLPMRRGYQRGMRQMVPESTLQTNDQGEFRMANLAPGRYYIVVFDRLARLVGSGGSNVQGGSLGTIPTYYPSAVDSQAAIALDVAPGAELRGIDIRVQQAKMFAIRGKVEGAAGANITLQAVPKEVINNSNIISQLSQSGASARPPEYTFELGNLVPGTYLIVPRMQSVVNGTPTQRAGNPVEVIVVDRDITALTVPITAGAPITGTVTFEGGDQKSLATASSQNSELLAAAAAAGVVLNVPGIRPTVGLIPAWSGTPQVSASSQINEAGEIRLEGVAPGKYQITMNGMPTGSYLKSAKFGGEDALRKGIDLSSGGGGVLDIVISNKAADVTGTVRDDKVKALGGLMVTLWSKEAEPGNTTNGVRTVYSDQNGGFQFRGLPPGEYFAAAWEDADAQLVMNRDFLAALSSEAAPVKLAEGARETIDAKLIPADKSKAAEEKLP